jgi:predicted enzyme related to lactoylglutathione lyase
MFTKIAFSIYAVSDVPRARKFYEEILGLKTNGEFDGSKNPNWVEYEIGPDTLAIGCSPDWLPSEHGASVALEVDNFDEIVKDLQNKGVSFKIPPQDFPSCKMAVVLDPDKNNITLHQKK